MRYLAIKMDNGQVMVYNDQDELGGLIDMDIPHEVLGEARFDYDEIPEGDKITIIKRDGTTETGGFWGVHNSVFIALISKGRCVSEVKLTLISLEEIVGYFHQEGGESWK